MLLYLLFAQAGATPLVLIAPTTADMLYKLGFTAMPVSGAQFVNVNNTELVAFHFHDRIVILPTTVTTASSPDSIANGWISPAQICDVVAFNASMIQCQLPPLLPGALLSVHLLWGVSMISSVSVIEGTSGATSNQAISMVLMTRAAAAYGMLPITVSVAVPLASQGSLRRLQNRRVPTPFLITPTSDLDIFDLSVNSMTWGGNRSQVSLLPATSNSEPLFLKGCFPTLNTNNMPASGLLRVYLIEYE